MSLDQVLANGRAAAEARMRDQVRLFLQSPDVFDRGTGNTVPGPQTTLYTGKARVRPLHAVGEAAEAGEREVTSRRYRVDLPWATPLPPGTRVLPGHRIEVTESLDTRLVGVELWVTDAEFGDQSTAWRISTEDRT